METLSEGWFLSVIFTGLLGFAIVVVLLLGWKYRDNPNDDEEFSTDHHSKVDDQILNPEYRILILDDEYFISKEGTCRDGGFQRRVWDIPLKHQQDFLEDVNLLIKAYGREKV